ncbi:MAG: M28 family peptidase [Planctomycetota bacterium JB042]
MDAPAPLLLACLLAAPPPAADPLPPEVDGITSERLMRHVEALASDDFEGRGAGTDGGRLGASYLISRFEALKLTPKGTREFRQPFRARGKEMANVVALIEGYDEERSKEFVVVGAHFDHLGRRRDDLYPGADDNASGCAALIEVARAFTLGGPPARSILFVGFDGEEVGLLGSRHFVRRPTVPKKEIVAMFNLDMVGRGEPGDVRVCGTSTAPLLKTIVERHAPRVGLTTHDDYERQWRNASDHAPFGDARIPFLYFGVLDHEDYHRPTDAAEKVVRRKIERIARLVYLTARETADGAERPEWDASGAGKARK